MLPEYNVSVQPALWFLYAKYQRNEAYMNVFAHNCEIWLRCSNALFDRKPSSYRARAFAAHDNYSADVPPVLTLNICAYSPQLTVVCGMEIATFYREVETEF